MKVLILALAVVVVSAQHHHVHTDEFVKWLQEIQKSDEYLAMPQTDKDMFQSLLLNAQKGGTELNAFITTQGLDTIIGLTDHLDKDDISHFMEMLAYYSDPTVFNPQHKRQSNMDLMEFMNEVRLMNKVLDDLHHEDRNMFMKLMYAVEHNQLTQFVADNGYAEIFKLLSEVDHDYSHQVDQMIMKHLEREAAMGLGNGHHTTMPPTTTGVFAKNFCSNVKTSYTFAAK